ncbi:hypothetical protein OHA98_36630 [Streptomyces sp. NBC_00654]|uniref:hypothetical protein n=1 Tax=Streptomyces sp. NBC_00654 TaxID=2975799 RepID=UPI0022547BD0|nr:hypothetical protein [Streptomyces sp. NBC_00654]MCX4970189.1 hypothetical protein [Streptomyces sp. NBC_00654]
MSELISIATALAPAFTSAATMFGSAVLTSASDRIADQTVTAGEGFFRRLVSRNRETGGEQATDPAGAPTQGAHGTDSGLDAERADELDALLDSLDEEERRKLAQAVTAWLRGPSRELDADHLVGHVHRVSGVPAPAPVTHITHNKAIAQGRYSIAANHINTVIVGGEQPPQDQR